MTNCTVALNTGSGGPGGAGGAGGYAGSGSVGLPGNVGSTGSSSGAGVGYSAFNTLLTDVADPKLGPLADNGGPTLTMALLPGSPAIDAGSAVGAPATDQRGVARPQGPGVDIGAFELQQYQQSIPVFMAATIQNGTNCQLQLSGLVPNYSFNLLVSTNLQTWSIATNFTADVNGRFQFLDPMPAQCGNRFYRLMAASP